MFMVLMAISGARSETDLSSTFVLMATTMLLGLLTEHGSRPQPDSNGERWVGDNADGSNKFRNYVWRMLPHIVGFVPFLSAWAVLLSVYHQTVRDVDDAFDINDEVPAYIFSAIYSTCATVTLRADAPPPTPCVCRVHRFFIFSTFTVRRCHPQLTIRRTALSVVLLLVPLATFLFAGDPDLLPVEKTIELLDERAGLLCAVGDQQDGARANSYREYYSRKRTGWSGGAVTRRTECNDFGVLRL